MIKQSKDLWSLIGSRQQIDPAELANAVETQIRKLFSDREKDADDLRFLKGQLDGAILARRLRDTTAALRSDPKLLKNAERNWYVLFGESLPS
jgi:hypothetical protein